MAPNPGGPEGAGQQVAQRRGIDMRFGWDLKAVSGADAQFPPQGAVELGTPRAMSISTMLRACH